MEQNRATAACRVFPATKNPVSCERYGHGHINETYRVLTAEGGDYILQKVNRGVFKNPEQVMENIALVTEHIGKKLVAKGQDPLRGTLHLCKTDDGKPYYIDGDGELWRVFDFVRDSLAIQMPRSTEEFASAGRAFGEFAAMLSDFPAEQLYDVIPQFHDTPKRYRDFLAAVERDVCGRAAEVKTEIEFYRARADYYHTLMRAHERGELPLRVTHNDTKINNILFDAESGAPLCVIDLDTVMPGFTVTDFGDAIRFGASSALEDETDLSKVYMREDAFEAFAKGFVSGLEGSLSETEIMELPMGALIITLETGIRFLTDYLNGDVYFRVHHSEHNLDRARNQFALVRDREKKMPRMREIVKQYI